MLRYKLTIVETHSNTPGSESNFGGESVTEYRDLDNLVSDLKRMYSRFNLDSLMKRNRVYIDIGDESIPVGFTVSFWNKDVSHNSKSWWQTDWVTVERMEIQSAYEELRERA